jgi:hypothetical protein
MKIVKILSSPSDLNRPTLNGSKRVGFLSEVLLQRRRDFVGIRVPVGGKVDDRALLVLH